MPKTERPVRYKRDPIDHGLAVQRALSMVGKTIYYRLGHGGSDPDAPTPAPIGGFCDCTGFTSWCDRIDRLQRAEDGDYWISTASLMDSVPTKRGTYGTYRHVYAPQLGDLLVYAADTERGRPYGHAGIITSIDAEKMPPEWDPTNRKCWQAIGVTHCHSTGGLKKSAISTESAWKIWGKLWGKPRGTAILRRSS
jgi:hypothetical protein